MNLQNIAITKKRFHPTDSAEEAIKFNYFFNLSLKDGELGG
jgi:hypothetical protein